MKLLQQTSGFCELFHAKVRSSYHSGRAD